MKKKRGLATLLAAGMMTAMLSVPVTAATTYTPVAGSATECTFKKYLIMDAGDTVPNATFSFTIAPGQAVSADTSDNAVMQVLPGVVVRDASNKITAPSITNVTFASTDATTSVADAAAITALTEIDVKRTQQDRTNTAGTDLVQLDAGEKFASGTATVDFSGVSFPEPGIYRYIIAETADTAHAAAGITHDTDVDRVLDVYVVDNSTATANALQVAAYVLHTNVTDPAIGTDMGPADVATAGAALADKTDGFTNEYSSKDLVFKKEVAGNQASRDKYFEFTAKLENVNDNDVFTVSLADDNDADTTDGNADATSGTTDATRVSNQGKTNPTSVSGAQLKAGVKFYLQHGQSIAIRGIAPNATYEISEDAEDYKSEAAAVNGYTDQVKTDSTNATLGAVAGDNKAVKTSFKNTRDGIIPTGILMSAAPWILLGVVVVGGVIFFLVRSRKKYEEE